MLQQLTIHNVVVIHQLQIPFMEGLTVLTGETGAGKSILLDALSLVLGKKANAKLIREGQETASVDAVFDISNSSQVKAILEDAGIQLEDDTLLIRRVITTDGRSKSFINDQPVTLNLLGEIGKYLVDIHGQFDRFFEHKHQRDLLDAYGACLPLRQEVKEAFEAWQTSRQALEDLIRQQTQRQDRIAYLDHCIQELAQLDPQPEEEETLVQKRQHALQAEKIIRTLEESEQCLSVASEQLHHAYKSLGKIAAHVSEPEAVESLDSTLSLLQEHSLKISHFTREWTNHGAVSLEDIEHRLHALRAAARKHQSTVTDLPKQWAVFQEEIQTLHNAEEQMQSLLHATDTLGKLYRDKAQALLGVHQKAAETLSKAVNQQLVPLKLEHATFKAQVDTLEADKWHAQGMDKIEFLIATNKNSKLGSLGDIASGGELSRIMLALKVVTTSQQDVQTLVFDEVDAGMGGSVASAVGHRLAQLSKGCQVLAVTHSPQVAAYADHHHKVLKEIQQANVVTSVQKLHPEEDSLEELARMLSGQVITDSARAAAKELRKAANAG
jgi:DNA repair protein RecN (Recombination protein N)